MLISVKSCDAIQESIETKTKQSISMAIGWVPMIVDMGPTTSVFPDLVLGREVAHMTMNANMFFQTQLIAPCD